jgi:hypothetical protein
MFARRFRATQINLYVGACLVFGQRETESHHGLDRLFGANELPADLGGAQRDAAAILKRMEAMLYSDRMAARGADSTTLRSLQTCLRLAGRYPKTKVWVRKKKNLRWSAFALQGGWRLNAPRAERLFSCRESGSGHLRHRTFRCQGIADFGTGRRGAEEVNVAMVTGECAGCGARALNVWIGLAANNENLGAIEEIEGMHYVPSRNVEQGKQASGFQQT